MASLTRITNLAVSSVSAFRTREWLRSHHMKSSCSISDPGELKTPTKPVKAKKPNKRVPSRATEFRRDLVQCVRRRQAVGGDSPSLEPICEQLDHGRELSTLEKPQLRGALCRHGPAQPTVGRAGLRLVRASCTASVTSRVPRILGTHASGCRSRWSCCACVMTSGWLAGLASNKPCSARPPRAPTVTWDFLCVGAHWKFWTRDKCCTWTVASLHSSTLLFNCLTWIRARVWPHSIAVSGPLLARMPRSIAAHFHYSHKRAHRTLQLCQ